MIAGNRRLRVAMFSYRLPVDRERRGGIERAAHTLADGLARRGHDVTVLTHDTKPANASYDVSPLPWERFVSTWLGRRATMGYLGNVLAVVPDYGAFDVVVMHGDSLLAPLIGKPVLRVMHGSALGEARSATSIGRRLLQYGVYVQELLTAVCHAGVVAVSECTTQDNPFIRRVVPHGVDGVTFHPGADARTPEPSVLFVGSMNGRKRGRFLLDGFVREVRHRHRNASLTLVGAEGPSHPGVVYLTGMADAQLAELYRRSWVYASPSTYEGFGLPYLEAMACGTPVVATRNPGSSEVLRDGAFGIMPPDSEFAATVSDLLGNERRRAELSSAGLKRAGEFSLDRMLDGYEQVLFELTEVHAGTVASV
ncbi:MAG TPA: glycosyltransferase family 4 protein [Vicinamibacterales bacterium]|nr:glycosyltransferase family 4 protein [Vicinamibacterales bacterium]